MEKKALFPMAYLPSVSYFATLMRYDSIVLEQYETFPKQTLRNRAVIATASGRMQLVVPVTHRYGNHTKTNEIGVTYAERWNVQHWRTIESAYNSSPYFLYYKDGIEKILMSPYERLLDLDVDLLRFLCKKLGIVCTIELSTDYIKKSEEFDDYRGFFPIKKVCEKYELLPYPQVFEEKNSFIPDLSILDLLFNLGPDAKRYLAQLEAL